MAEAMTEALIRPARPDDAAALAVLGRQTFVDTFVEGFGIPYPADDLAAFLEKSFSVETISAKLIEPGAAWWVADRDGEIVLRASPTPGQTPCPIPTRAPATPNCAASTSAATRKAWVWGRSC